MLKTISKPVAMMGTALFLFACAGQDFEVGHDLPLQQIDKPGARYEDGRFHNEGYEMTFDLGLTYKALTSARHEASTPDHSLPFRTIPGTELKATGEDRLYRLGHSTVLMELSGEWVITDPVFVERASPVQWLGPKRFESTPVELEQLPHLKAVVISHNHYDHLDKQSIQQLKDRTDYFVVPLKLGDLLIRWGVASEKVVELDWWKGVELGELTITATPAQHYSSRSLTDRNETLWASYVLETDDTRLFFSGDSGYFGGFAEIGRHFGGFDLALMEVGAYNELWRDIHMLPEDALQAQLDLNAGVMVPIHNATFDLGRHAWWEPFEAMESLGQAHDVEVLMPRFGEQVSVHNPEQYAAWWKDYIDESGLELVMEQP